MRFSAIFCVSFCLTVHAYAQVDTAPVEGLRENTPRLHVLRGATVFTKPGEKIENGTIVLRDGFIEAIGGADLEAPANARSWDLSGMIVYAGFIDAASLLGSSVSISSTNTHWNSQVRPERRAVEFKPPSAEQLETHRTMGFTTAHLVPGTGIFRGQSAAIHLDDDAAVLAEDIRQCLAFDRADGNYPSSLMGCVALVRQTLHDARWYRDMETHLRDNPDTERPATNTALAALGPVVEKKQPLLARTGDELDYARFIGIAREFELDPPALIGNGREYRQTALLKESGATMILPLEFPKAPPVEIADAALEISLEKLEQWERAPANAAALAKKEIPICLTVRGLDKPKDNFWKNVRNAVKHGLSHDDALGALTTEPATVMGLSDRVGTIEPGRIADLVVADGDLFSDEDASVHQVWIDGRPFDTDAAGRVELRGKWSLQWNGVEAAEEWKVSGSVKEPKLKIGDEEAPIKSEGEKVLVFPAASLFEKDARGTVRLVGYVETETGSVRGSGHLPSGDQFSWSAKIEPGEAEEDEDDEEEEDFELAEYSKYPAGAFGYEEIPDQAAGILIKNATIWTCGEESVIEGGTLLIRNGKIRKVGKNLDVKESPKLLVIDAAGKHVTPGLIDCHSHSAISRGINEGTHAVTVECRVGDVVDPTDIALYRELAGGLTTASLLHGSANPMGGQNQVIKLRWGSRSADGLKFSGAKPGVKFALGENVKRSNWDDPGERYPLTRMGVEQIMKDTFLAARDYQRKRAEAEAEGRPHRRDLRLEAALEILEKDRIVHIHSYRQDEILMFVRLSQEFDFTVGTFQHILEGYKVADALAEIDAGGSSFSDWWGYKFEVYDAIPYNGALLHEAGVVTSFNSDSNELATRMNTEAAKAVKYGGLSEEEALKFVTINPAIQLRIDKQVGSLEPGKDADFVIWSDHPLSSFARAEQTWIEGRKYFDIETDLRLRDEALAERERLIAKALPRRMKSLDKKKEGEEEDEEAEKKDPDRFWFLRKDWNRKCLSSERGLYHDGLDSHTCTANCCGVR
jgi:imidazolonepropionase-like amidohydrolase